MRSPLACRIDYPDPPPVLPPERSLAGGEGGASERNCGWRTIPLPLTASG